MRALAIRLFIVATLAVASTGVSAQQLRRPADAPPNPGTLRPIDGAPTGTRVLQMPPPARALPTDVTRPATPNPALSLRERCLQTANRSIQAPSDNRLAASQRRIAATDVQRTARNTDATDPTDRSGLRAQRDAQQRAMVRERNATNQQLALAQSNCIGD